MTAAVTLLWLVAIWVATDASIWLGIFFALLGVAPVAYSQFYAATGSEWKPPSFLMWPPRLILPAMIFAAWGVNSPLAGALGIFLLATIVCGLLTVLFGEGEVR